VLTMWQYVLASVIVPQLWALVLTRAYRRIDERRVAKESRAARGSGADYVI
jgi:hypothetical protein